MFFLGAYMVIHPNLQTLQLDAFYTFMPIKEVMRVHLS